MTIQKMKKTYFNWSSGKPACRRQGFSIEFKNETVL